MTTAPDRTEASEYYFTYIDKVPRGDICRTLEHQSAETLALLHGITEEASLRRYTPEKWSIRQVVSHVNDAERLFVFRAFWFARGFDSALPSFDPDLSAAADGAEARTWISHVEEFRALRAATLAFFQHLPADAWTRAGVASGNRFTVRALAYIVAGHVTHHTGILRERYLSGYSQLPDFPGGLMSSDTQQHIGSVNSRFVGAFGRGDAAAIAELYTSDAQLLPAHTDVVTGTTAIRAFWQSVIDMGLEAASLETSELDVHGDTAIEVGRYRLIAAGGVPADNGKYVVVWKNAGGAWKLHRDIWTTSQPAAAVV